ALAELRSGAAQAKQLRRQAVGRPLAVALGALGHGRARRMIRRRAGEEGVAMRDGHPQVRSQPLSQGRAHRLEQEARGVATVACARVQKAASRLAPRGETEAARAGEQVVEGRGLDLFARYSERARLAGLE